VHLYVLYIFSPRAIVHTAAKSNEILYNCIQTGKNGKTTAPYRHRESAVTAHRYSLSGHIHYTHVVFNLHTHIHTFILYNIHCAYIYNTCSVFRKRAGDRFGRWRIIRIELLEREIRSGRYVVVAS